MLSGNAAHDVPCPSSGVSEASLVQTMVKYKSGAGQKLRTKKKPQKQSFKQSKPSDIDARQKKRSKQSEPADLKTRRGKPAARKGRSTNVGSKALPLAMAAEDSSDDLGEMDDEFTGDSGLEVAGGDAADARGGAGDSDEEEEEEDGDGDQDEEVLPQVSLLFADDHLLEC
jgi:hypothetical protein